MTRGRRGILLAGLAAILGWLAAADVSERENAVRRQLAPLVEVAVARHDLEASRPLREGDLAARRVPERFAPADSRAPVELVGQELAVAVPRGTDLQSAHLRDDSDLSAVAVGPGERAAEVTGAGSAELVVPGAHVDVLVVEEGERAAARVALSDAEVLAARPADEGAAASGQPAVTVTLRVTVRQAVALAAAEAGARAVRLLARPA